ncbi:MAG: hypothetical protein ABIJ56_23915, partial [Pseudomonadota bacterium]
MKEKEKQAVYAVLASWAEKHGAEVTSHDDSGGQPYWTLTPADAPEGGDITVCPRRGKPVSPPG